jgi:hypothetical protein
VIFQRLSEGEFHGAVPEYCVEFSCLASALTDTSCTEN